jgi:hypothetical protein
MTRSGTKPKVRAPLAVKTEKRPTTWKATSTPTTPPRARRHRGGVAGNATARAAKKASGT